MGNYMEERDHVLIEVLSRHLSGCRKITKRNTSVGIVRVHALNRNRDLYNINQACYVLRQLAE
jgi:hypothetical protein